MAAWLLLLAAALGIACFGESATPLRLGLIALIVLAIAGLKIAPA